MRVLQLISSIGFFGAENVLIELCKELRHTNFKPILGIFKNRRNLHLEVAEKAKQYNLPVAIFPCDRKFDLKTFLAVRKFLKNSRIDIIHTHNYKSNFYALFSSLGMNMSLIATCHNWLGNTAKMKFYANLDKFFLNRFDRVIAVSDNIKQEILRQKIQPKKVLTIPNGIDIKRFSGNVDGNGLRREFGIEQDCKIIGTIGRLTKEKGHTVLLAASEKVLQKYPKAVFLLVGDGPLREDLEKKVGKSSVIFTGVRNDMPSVYSAIDVFVLPSLNEGLPMVLLEAMCSKKPIVATKVGAIPTVVNNTKTGLLVDPGDENQLAKALLYLLCDEDKGKLMGEEGYKTVSNNFSSQKMAEKYVEVYKEILAIQKTR